MRHLQSTSSCGVESVSVDGSGATGGVAHCVASPCPWWCPLPWDTTAELPRSAQASSADSLRGSSLATFPSPDGVPGLLGHAEEYRQTGFPLILHFGVPEAFPSPDRLGTVRVLCWQGGHLLPVRLSWEPQSIPVASRSVRCAPRAASAAGARPRGSLSAGGSLSR